MALILRCGIDENCRLDWRDTRAIIGDLGSDGINTVEWTIETLDAAFAKYPLLPEDSPALQVMAGLGLSVTGLDTVTDFAALVSGRDPLTGRALTPRDMFITWLALSIPFVAASALHGFADDAAELLADFRPLREAGCSFDAETPVTTDEGPIPIKDVDVGDKVLAWDEVTNSTGYFLVTATWAHEDPVTVLLTVDSETIETTPEHPFLTADGTWVTADELAVGDELQGAAGHTGTVEAVAFVAAPQTMYNLTVADAHTYVVGDGEWVVHNACQLNTSLILFSQAKYTTSGRIDDLRRYQVADNVQWLIDNPGLDLPFGGPIEVFLKQPFMDAWGPLKHPTKDYIGDPVNLANGYIYTLDNRRLVTYILAMRDKVPVHWAYLDTIKAKRFEFDTPNFGIWIDPRVK